MGQTQVMKTLGHIAYDAHETWAIESGRIHVEWQFLPNSDHDMWEAIAEAVEKEVKARMEPEE